MKKVTYTKIGDLILGSDGSRKLVQGPPVTKSKFANNLTPGSIAANAVKNALAKIKDSKVK